MRFGPVLPNILFYFQLLQLADDPRSEEKRNKKSGEDRQNRPEGDIAKDVKDRMVRMQRIKQKVKHDDLSKSGQNDDRGCRASGGHPVRANASSRSRVSRGCETALPADPMGFFGNH